MRFEAGQHIHLIGIGGAGLSAIASVLLQQGFEVSGSDRNSNALTEGLARDGATIYKGHDAAHVDGAQVVIRSSAVPLDHVEVEAAQERGIPVYKRNDVMAAMMEGKRVVAVAGTHGKTTTTAMIVHVLRECGVDPSYIVGGVMINTGTNAGVGQGDVFVVEADEYDNMFHGLRPDLAIVTNVEYDHPDFFGSQAAMIKAFWRFVDLLPGDSGLLIACADSGTARNIAETRRASGGAVVTYGLGHGAFFRGANVHVDEDGLTVFNVIPSSSGVASVRLTLAGEHNVQNALAALLVAENVGLSLADAAAALTTFEGTYRRLELRGEVNGVTVIDDYAHHPTAIKATLEAARARYPDSALWAVWQPHTYSRTRELLELYKTAFDSADHVLVTEIYAAREQPMAGVDGASVAAVITHPDVRFVPTFAAAVEMLAARVNPPAVIVTMSAGDAPEIGEAYLENMRNGFRRANDDAANSAG
jgi:UDP-N-acetylmuramate--alanine ligase